METWRWLRSLTTGIQSDQPRRRCDGNPTQWCSVAESVWERDSDYRNIMTENLVQFVVATMRGMKSGCGTVQNRAKGMKIAAHTGWYDVGHVT